MNRYVFSSVLILGIFFTRITFAQPVILKGTWVTVEQDLIEILDTGRVSANHLSNKLLKDDFFHLYIFHDTLSFQHIYTSSLTQFKIEYTDRYDLKIVSCNDSILILRPVSNFSKEYFQGRSVLTLKRKEYLFDKTISFEKLIYHATRAWSGPTISLEIDSNKSLYMHYTNNTGGADSGMASGNYSAVLDDASYKELIYNLQHCNLRTMRFGNIEGADSPVVTLIVYFNGKRKYLKSMFPPRISNDLLAFIRLRVQNFDKLIPTHEIRKIEQ
jgi:hypothetical protein